MPTEMEGRIHDVLQRRLFEDPADDLFVVAGEILRAIQEPTTEQLAAGQKAWRDDELKRSSTLYRAMIGAAISNTSGDIK